MKVILRLLTALMVMTAGLAVPAIAADKPLVIETGKIRELPANTTLQVNGSGTGAASINIPHGTAPSSPTNGDCWTTTSGLFCRINGATVGPYGTGGGGSITAKDEGSTLTTAVTSMDFTGAGVTATNSSGAVTVNVPGPTAYRGALVTKSADQTAANYSGGVVVTWDSESRDTSSIHSTVTNTGRMTVPSGVTKVQLEFNLLLSAVTTNTLVQAAIRKNGTDFFVGNATWGIDNSGTSPRFGGVTAVLDVTAGDYFELALATVDTSINVIATYSWFSMDVVE